MQAQEHTVHIKTRLVALHDNTHTHTPPPNNNKTPQNKTTQLCAWSNSQYRPSLSVLCQVIMWWDTNTGAQEVLLHLLLKTTGFSNLTKKWGLATFDATGQQTTAIVQQDIGAEEKKTQKRNRETGQERNAMFTPKDAAEPAPKDYGLFKPDKGRGLATFDATGQQTTARVQRQRDIGQKNKNKRETG